MRQPSTDETHGVLTGEKGRSDLNINATESSQSFYFQTKKRLEVFGTGGVIS